MVNDPPMRDLRSRRALVAPTLSLLALLSSVGCAKTPEPDPSAAPKREPPAATTARAADTSAAAAPKPAQGPSDLGWEAPATWQKAENPSSMRIATYKIPRAAGDAEDGELSISKAGGSVDANIQRWAGQFQTKSPDAVKRTPKTVNGMPVTVVEIRGTFTGSGMPGGPPGDPKTSYALLGAIVEAGQASWFFKLTGPEKTLDAAKADFDKFVDSLRAK